MKWRNRWVTWDQPAASSRSRFLPRLMSRSRSQLLSPSRSQSLSPPSQQPCPKCGCPYSSMPGMVCFACALTEIMKSVGSLTATSLRASSTLGALGAELSERREDPLEVVHQDDLMQGTKYATLWDIGGKPRFRGAGWDTSLDYGTESYASCGQNHPHVAPDEGCHCGYWIATHPESRLAKWEPGYVALEVEFGGKVLDCGKDPLPAPPWGYRAQWQRVLSVSLYERCGAGGSRCPRVPLYLVANHDGRLRTACSHHAALGSRLISNPVSWLREGLQTEIRPGTVTDSAEPPASYSATSGGGGGGIYQMPAWTRTTSPLPAGWIGGGTTASVTSSSSYYPPLFLPATRKQMQYTQYPGAPTIAVPPAPYPAYASNVQIDTYVNPDGSITWTWTWDE